MERAIHARELRLEGADGPDGREVYKSAPNRGNEIELLLYAANLLRESGKADRARAVQELGELFQETRKRSMERERRREREHDGARERDHETHVVIEELAEQSREQQHAIHQLAEQLERLAKSNQRLQEQLKKVTRRR